MIGPRVRTGQAKHGRPLREKFRGPPAPASILVQDGLGVERAARDGDPRVLERAEAEEGVFFGGGDAFSAGVGQGEEGSVDHGGRGVGSGREAEVVFVW